MRRAKENGQAIILVVVFLGLLLLGGLGLAIDGSHLYAQRQMAQVAADAAAEAGMMSVYDKTNPTSGGGAWGVSTGTTFTCTTTDTRTPCVYARYNGFGANSSDIVKIDFLASDTGVALCGDAVALTRATVIRTVTTGLLRFLGPATAKVAAQATAACVDVVSPVPIIVTHPSKSASFQKSGNNIITICGGPNQSIQVNSTSSTSINVNGSGPVDLSKAGPDDPGDCSTGTGANFGDTGGPAAYPGILQLGTRPGTYVQPHSPILDPLAFIAAPALPATINPPTCTAKNATPYNACQAGQPGTFYGCPAAQTSCVIFFPGRYTTGAGLTVSNGTWALFRPGLYYITQGGFNMGPNTAANMATGFANDPDTGDGMVVFNTGSGNGDIFNFVANAGSKGPIILKGAPAGPPYHGLLFFEDHAAGAHNDVGAKKGHQLQGGGTMTLTGTIYLTNTLATVIADPTHFQAFTLSGNPGSTTTIIGEIIADTLQLNGDANIKMHLDPDATLHIRQVALVR